LWGFEKGREKREKRKESDLTQRALRKSAEFAEKNEAKSTG
jgi:hypothetical protein